MIYGLYEPYDKLPYYERKAVAQFTRIGVEYYMTTIKNAYYGFTVYGIIVKY